MIRKFLVVGKNSVTFSTAKVEDEHSSYTCIEVLMPLTVYWNLQEIFREYGYVLASQENPSDVQEIIRKIFKKMVAYVISERDRVWLIKRILLPTGLASSPEATLAAAPKDSKKEKDEGSRS